MAATQDEVDRVIVVYEDAKQIPGYVDSIVLEMQQNSETDYRMIWTNQYPT